MDRINAQVACTLGGGVVGGRLGGTEGGGIGQHGAWRIGGFTGGTLDGEIIGGALGLQLLAITVSSLSSPMVKM